MSSFESGRVFGFNEMKALQELLNPNKNSSDESSDEEQGENNKRKMGPAELIPTSKQEIIQIKKEEGKVQQEKILPTELEAEEKDEIDKWLEKQHKEDSDILETRKRPEYSIIYKQVVGTEDLFLGMNNRTPASMSCEDMIVKIQMPEETISVDEMNLEVTESCIDLKTSIYRLKLPLVHPINPDKGSARFDTDQKCLILTLRMKRELDFVNF